MVDKVTDSMKNLFVIENGLNTCYMDSLLMALFYKPSTYLESILHSDPKNLDAIYLQEIIKNKFVDQVRKNNSVLADVINEIRIYANVCGWLENSSNECNELFEQQDVNEFYSFLLNITNAPLIEIQRQTISEAFESKSDISELESIPFINLTVPDNIDATSIKDLLNNWMNSNTVEDIKREVQDDKGQRKIESVKALNIYKIVNVPTFIALSINRFNSNVNRRIETRVDIQKKIKLHHILDGNDGLRWKIHSMICHRGETPKGGHYYTVLFGSDNTWLIFDDQSVPCLKEVQIKDTKIAETIKREVVLTLYCYDETI
jgi:ubiquitin C-terminal hydrolase